MRRYSDPELKALRTVTVHEWANAGDPAERGPAQYAGGAWWPDELARKAREMQRRAEAYLIASAALRREIHADPLTSEDPA